jgi:ankyrin repeat protein
MNAIISAIQRKQWSEYDELMNNTELSNIDPCDIVQIIKHLWTTNSGKEKSYILLTYLANKNLLDIHNGFSYNLIKYAILNNYVDLVRYLLDHGSDPKLGNEQFSCLDMADYCGHIEILNMLKEHNAQQEQINSSAKSARMKK